MCEHSCTKAANAQNVLVSDFSYYKCITRRYFMIKTFDINETAIEKSYYFTVVREGSENEVEYHNFGSHCA